MTTWVKDTQKTNMQISAENIRNLTHFLLKYLFWILLILFLLDMYVYFFAESKYMQELFNIASEKTPATWLSSTILLLLSVQFFVLAHISKKQLWNYAGYFFIYLSLDDASYVHEQVSSWINQKSVAVAQLPSYGWLYVIAPILAVILGKIFYEIYIEIKKYKLPLLPLMFTTSLLGFSIMLDFIDGYFTPLGLTQVTTHYLRVSEEIIEVIAFAILVKSMSLLLESYITRNQNYGKKKKVSV